MALCRREIVKRMLSLCSAMLRLAGSTNTIFFWAILFDSTPTGRLLLSHNTGEAFALCADDKVIGRGVYLNGEFDFGKFESVFEMLGGKRDCGLIVDVGANIGVICIPAVRRGLFKSAIAFEPDPRNFGLLKANIYLNGLASKISAHNIALGGQDGQTISLTLSRDNHGDHRVQSDGVAERGLFGEESRETVNVRSETLDSVVSIDSPATTLIWMDTQGFEGFILAGAARALATRVPIVAEFWPYGMNRSGSFPAMKNALQVAGNESFIDLADPTASIPLTTKSLDDLYHKIGESGNFTDILVR